MLFWLITLGRYFLAALAALFFSVILSVMSTLLFARPGDDSYTEAAFGFLWFLVFSAEAGLIIPLSLAITAELVERRVQVRRFKWSKALSRFLIALPIGVGPVYAAVFVIPFVDSRRPAHWAPKEVLFYCLSGVFAYFALRITRQPIRTGQAGYSQLSPD